MVVQGWVCGVVGVGGGREGVGSESGEHVICDQIE